MVLDPLACHGCDIFGIDLVTCAAVSTGGGHRQQPLVGRVAGIAGMHVGIHDPLSTEAIHDGLDLGRESRELDEDLGALGASARFAYNRRRRRVTPPPSGGWPAAAQPERPSLRHLGSH